MNPNPTTTNKVWSRWGIGKSGGGGISAVVHPSLSRHGLYEMCGRCLFCLLQNARHSKVQRPAWREPVLCWLWALGLVLPCTFLGQFASLRNDRWEEDALIPLHLHLLHVAPVLLPHRRGHCVDIRVYWPAAEDRVSKHGLSPVHARIFIRVKLGSNHLVKRWN